MVVYPLRHFEAVSDASSKIKWAIGLEPNIAHLYSPKLFAWDNDFGQSFCNKSNFFNNAEE